MAGRVASFPHRRDLDEICLAFVGLLGGLYILPGGGKEGGGVDVLKCRVLTH